ncbi:YggT family protein [Micropruina sonneratiae]|uniref:YggT family protein n=1 Tax=Micropruina sonneratiae TaxID=2986940 RepID=UPI00222656FC|nr:YggT family protein [Micropruina sp. KQZ13P-5]MCW3157149.1 YggT family protein [Micropruina sp. KQZ13P-5]
MQFVGLVLWYVLWAYLAVLMVRAVLSFVPLFVRDWQPRGVMLVVAEFVYTLTDPPLRFMRKLIPPLRIGSTSWDLGFLVLFIGLSFLQRLIPVIFF